MSPVGKMGEFCEENEDWSQYVERVEFFFTANGIEGEERKRAVLLTVMGPAAFGLLKRLVEPRKVARESFDSLVAIMRDHLESEPSDIVQRFRFNSRDRKPCESVALFNAELSKLAGRCNFGRVRDDMLRDRLVCGVNDELIQRRLLSERGLTYERALEIALAIETAPKDVAAKSVTNTVLWSPQGAMETGSRLHRALRRCPSAWQEQEVYESSMYIKRAPSQRDSFLPSLPYDCVSIIYVLLECTFRPFRLLRPFRPSMILQARQISWPID